MIPVAIGFCIGIYVVGEVFVAAAARSAGDEENHLWAGALGAVWPLLAVVGLATLPFLAIGWLGARVRNWTASHK